MNVSSIIDIFPNLSYPLDNSHVRRFSSLSAQTAFFDNLSKVRLENYKYTRVDEYEFTITVGSTNASSPNAIDITQAINWGYVRVNNFFKANKWVYAFIRQTTYNNNGGVILHCRVDFYQSFCFDIEILPSFVERQHEPLYQSNGLPVLNTVDEGLAYGMEYRNVYSTDLKVSDLLYLCIVTTKKLGLEDSGFDVISDVGVPTPLYYYVVPFFWNNSQSIEVTAYNRTYYVPSLIGIFKELKGNEEYVNSVVSLYVTTNCGVPFDTVLDGYNLNLGNSNQLFSPTMCRTELIDTETGTNILIRVLNIRNFPRRNLEIENKYQNVPNYKESKLKMYPYTVLVMTDLKGNQLEVKPEFIMSESLQISIRGSLGTQNKVGYYPQNYRGIGDEQDFILVDDSPNNIPIVTEATADYIQGNQNSINMKQALANSNAIVETGSSIVSAIPFLFTPATAPMGVANAVTGTANAINRRHNEIKTLEAKQADIDNIPPNAKNMGGNTAYEWGNGLEFPKLVIKTVTEEYADKLTDFFHMFGYQINELRVPNQANRQHFNYIKCATVNLRSGLNRDILDNFRKIFEDGVTLWHTNDIMNYNLTNEEV